MKQSKLRLKNHLKWQFLDGRILPSCENESGGNDKVHLVSLHSVQFSFGGFVFPMMNCILISTFSLVSNNRIEASPDGSPYVFTVASHKPSDEADGMA